MNKPRQIRRSCCGVDFLLQVRCAAISGTCGSGLPLEAPGALAARTPQTFDSLIQPLEAAAVTVQATVQLRADRVAGNDQQVDQKQHAQIWATDAPSRELTLKLEAKQTEQRSASGVRSADIHNLA